MSSSYFSKMYLPSIIIKVSPGFIFLVAKPGLFQGLSTVPGFESPPQGPHSKCPVRIRIGAWKTIGAVVVRWKNNDFIL